MLRNRAPGAQLAVSAVPGLAVERSGWAGAHGTPRATCWVWLTWVRGQPCARCASAHSPFLTLPLQPDATQWQPPSICPTHGGASEVAAQALGPHLGLLICCARRTLTRSPCLPLGGREGGLQPLPALPVLCARLLQRLVRCCTRAPLGCQLRLQLLHVALLRILRAHQADVRMCVPSAAVPQGAPRPQPCVSNRSTFNTSVPLTPPHLSRRAQCPPGVLLLLHAPPGPDALPSQASPASPWRAPQLRPLLAPASSAAGRAPPHAANVSERQPATNEL